METEKTKSKNMKLAFSFYSFCVEHPELRFWQALRAWSGADKIYYERFNKNVDDIVVEDTFYWEHKNK